MSKIKILLGFAFNLEGFSDLDDRFEMITPKEGKFTNEEIIERLPGIEVFVPNFSMASRVDERIIDAGIDLKLICNYGVGYDNIDVVYAAKKGIAVTNTPTAVLEPTAEVAFAHILATARRIGYFNHKLHNKERVDWSLFGDLGMPVYGQTLGIFGMGRIGQAIARRALAFGMKIIYHNRKRVDEAIEKQYQATYVDFDTLLKQSDFLSLNAPATSETKHIINADSLAKMKKTAFLINTARGSLVDEQALIKALKEKTIMGAGLDVYENEPKISPELFDLDNVVLTPHIGTKTMAYRLDMQREVAKNIINFYEGKPIDRVN